MVKRVQGRIVRLRELLDYSEERLREPFVFRTRRDLAVVLGAVGSLATEISDEIIESMPKRQRKAVSK